MTVRFRLNGDLVEAGAVDHHLTVLQWLRASGRTGTKEGCSEGECGACAIAVLRRDIQGRARFESINSCLVPLPAADGWSIVTVEGVAGAGGELHPVQRAMVEHGGSQCGYCTPGFVMSLFCEYHRPGRSGYEPEAIAGNLCRCTGYRPIADVARALPQPAAHEPSLARLPLLQGSRSEPSAFEHGSATSRFARPLDLPGVFRYLTAWPDAVLIAGGTDLMVEANQRYTRFPALVSLEAVHELLAFERSEREIAIGAALPLSALEDHLRDEHHGVAPLLEQLLPLFSSRLVRNRATLGGNLATASPIGDSLPVLLAIDAEVKIASARGERRLPVSDFVRAYRTTALEPGEIIVSVHIPLPLPRVQRFYKVSKRVLDDISSVSAAFAIDMAADGRVARLRIAYGGVAATPLRAHAAEREATSKPWSHDTLAAVLRELALVGTPIDDHRASANYRRAMVGKLLEKFFAATADELAAAP